MVPVRPCVFIIRDGWGVREEREGNAVYLAKLPRHEELWSKYPTALVETVGGNGYVDMGAGRSVEPDRARVSRAIDKGDFFENDVLLAACQRASERNRALHLIGLVSDGGVHAREEHLHALVELARRQGVPRLFVHAVTDGRDTGPREARAHLAQLEGKLRTLGLGRIATVGGRSFGMDRDRRWDREKKAYDAIVHGRSSFRGADPLRLVEESYARGAGDETVEPSVVADEKGEAIGPVRRGDQLVFFNVRADRARQLAHALSAPAFEAFDRGPAPALELVTLTDYGPDVRPAGVAFPSVPVESGFSQAVSALGLSQWKGAETEKAATVTAFWNGGGGASCPGESRALVDSPRIARPDEKPELSAREVAAAAVKRLQSHEDALLVVGFANPDLLGHTGNLDATVRGLEVVDECVGRVIDAARAKGCVALVTSGHGNCETMLDPATKEPHTRHTGNPVHAILVSDGHAGRRVRSGGTLADLAPTALELMGLEAPRAMTGRSLLVTGG